jgi:hypothetical protein
MAVRATFGHPLEVFSSARHQACIIGIFGLSGFWIE